MSDTDYTNAWLVYIVASLVVTLGAWGLTRRVRPIVQYPLLLLITAFMLTPFNIETGSKFMGPAWLITFYEGVFVPEVGFARAGSMFATVLVISLLIYPVLYGIYFSFAKLFGGRNPTNTESEA
ncbi:hypothetical protein [Sessilibacter sp. MAH2]